MHAFRIVLLTLGAAIGYGIVHDQFTARLCVEYFTVAHPPLFPTESPTLLAIGWGIVATWWVALPFGLLLAAAARIGPWPKWTTNELRRPVLLFLCTMAACAVASGVTAGVLMSLDRIAIPEYWAVRIPASRHTRFMIAAWAHNASYLSGTVAGLAIAAWTVVGRRGEARSASRHGTIRHTSFGFEK
jgi:hypothetical protein